MLFRSLPLFSPSNSSPACESNPAEILAIYREEIRFCEKCSLHIGREKLVFGRGHVAAKIAFVGDFPSQLDDKSGEPFSGKDGALLDKMITAMKIRPEESYLTQVFKCRPPARENPGQSHMDACSTHLKFQFSKILAPVIIAMGELSAQYFARSDAPLPILRKQVFSWEGRKVIPTHHPRDLHESPAKKKEAWEDLQFAMRELERQ